MLLLYLSTVHKPVLHHDGSNIHKALAVPGHILTTGACDTFGRIYVVDYTDQNVMALQHSLKGLTRPSKPAYLRIARDIEPCTCRLYRSLIRIGYVDPL